MSTRESIGRTGKQRTVAAEESTFRRLQSRGERLLDWFPELGKTLVREGEPALESILAQLQTVRGTVSRRAQETGRDLEARAERLLADIERQAIRGLQPLLQRAQVAFHDELGSLRDRVAHVEDRLGPLLDDRAELNSKLQDLGRIVDEARADASERFRDVSVRLAAGDELRGELGALHEHLDALSKDHVTRNLEAGKLQDRIVRMEMRLGDLLKEQGTRAGEQAEIGRRLATIESGVEEARRLARGVAEETAGTAAATREVASRIGAVAEGRAADHDELGAMARRLDEIGRTLRQVELRLGDLSERQATLREEQRGLVARVGQLELASARTTTPTVVSERNEGH